MSTPTVSKPPHCGKPELHPIVVALRHVVEVLAERDRLAAMFRTWKGRE